MTERSGRIEPRIIVVADDLTGANDAGVQIAKRGIGTVTLLDPDLLGEVSSQAIVFDTESRSLTPDSAREAVRKAVRGAPLGASEICYKKIDSTLRGNIGAELAVLIEELSPDSVVCVPAYPKNGRTTRGGIHRINGVPIAETEFADEAPIADRSSSLTALLARGGGPEFHHLTLETLRSRHAAREAAAHRFVSFDCEEQADLEQVVALMRAGARRILWCGSAGLAEVLMEADNPRASGGSSPHRHRAAPTDAVGTAAGSGAPAPPLLAVVGSTSEATQRQLGAATGSASTAIVRLDPAAALASFDRERLRLAGELERLERSSATTAAAPLRLILAAPGAAGAAKPGSAGLDIARVASRCLGAAAALYLERRRVSGLFLTGGQTAYEVAHASSVRGMTMERELSPGIPLVRFIGGVLDGLPGVTKAGGFGDERALVRSLDAIAAFGYGRS